MMTQVDDFDVSRLAPLSRARYNSIKSIPLFVLSKKFPLERALISRALTADQSARRGVLLISGTGDLYGASISSCLHRQWTVGCR